MEGDIVMDSVDDYVNSYDGVKKEWITIFIIFMRKSFPNVKETMWYQMPTYKFNGQYIAFSIAKNHFTLHTLDFELIEGLKNLLPKEKFGKGCVKVNYTDKAAIPVLFDVCRKIVYRSNTMLVPISI